MWSPPASCSRNVSSPSSEGLERFWDPRPGPPGPRSGGAQYQPLSCLKVSAWQGDPYRSMTYQIPHFTWVIGLVRQFDPKTAILDPGNACGIPYAPLTLPAVGFHFDSAWNVLLMQLYWVLPSRYSAYAFAPATVSANLGGAAGLGLGLAVGLGVGIEFGFSAGWTAGASVQSMNSVGAGVALGVAWASELKAVWYVASDRLAEPRDADGTPKVSGTTTIARMTTTATKAATIAGAVGFKLSSETVSWLSARRG